MNLSDAITQVYRNLRDLGDDADKQLLTDTEIEPYVVAAVARYSSDRPRVVVEPIEADGSPYAPLPEAWDPAVSAVRYVELPSDAGPQVIDPRAYSIWDTPDGQRLLWLGTKPLADTTYHLHFTVAHQIDDESTTVPQVHHHAVIDLATSFGADAVGAKYAATSEGVLSVDAANYRSKQQEWTAIARRYRDRYRDALRAVDAVASGRVNWDSHSSLGTEHLTHRRVWR